MIKNSLKKNDVIRLWALRVPERSEAFDAEFYENRNRDDVVNTGFENPSGLASFNEGPAPKTINDLPKYEVQQLEKNRQMLVDYRTMSAAHEGVKKFFVITFYGCLVILGFMLPKYLIVVLVSIIQERKAKRAAGPG